MTNSLIVRAIEVRNITVELISNSKALIDTKALTGTKIKASVLKRIVLSLEDKVLSQCVSHEVEADYIVNKILEKVWDFERIAAQRSNGYTIQSC